MHVWQFFPPYNLGKGLVSLSALDLQTTFLGGTAHPYQWDILGRPITLMLLEAVGYMILTLIIDDDWLSYVYDLVRNYLAPKSPQPSAGGPAASNGKNAVAVTASTCQNYQIKAFCCACWNIINKKRRQESENLEFESVGWHLLREFPSYMSSGR